MDLYEHRLGARRHLLEITLVKFFIDDAESLVDGSVLTPGGRIMSSVRAHPRLSSSQDTDLARFRRSGSNAASTLFGKPLEIIEGGSPFGALLLRTAVSVLLHETQKVTSVRGTMSPNPPVRVGGWSVGPRMKPLLTKACGADAQIGEFARQKGATLPALTYFAACAAP